VVAVSPLRSVALVALTTLILAGCSGTKTVATSKTVHGGTTKPQATTSTARAAADETDPLDEAQQCLDSWNRRNRNPALATFLLASEGKGVKRVSVGYTNGDACLFSFAARNGLLVQAVEVNPPSGRFTGLWPPGRVENFDVAPVGWNASANPKGFVTLRRPGVRSDLSPIPVTETTSFPMELEDEVLESTPSDGWQCQRSDERTEGAVVGVVCDPSDGISVRYESFESPSASRAAYWSYFKASAENDVPLGSSCVRNEIGEGWIRYPDGASGRLFCFTDSHSFHVIWTRDDRRIVAIASGRDREGLVAWWREGGGSIS
jgi:hypothetical protein